MRSAILAASALALLAAAAATAPTAAAQDAINQGTGGQSAAPAAAGTTPLMTAPRPEDTATTSPQSSQEGMDGNAPSDEKTAPAQATSGQGTVVQGTAGGQEEMAAAPPMMLDEAAARGLVGRDVQTRDGKSGGMVRDFTLGGPNGGIDRVVLSSGAFIGAEAEMISVPASELRMDAPESASTPPASEKPTTRLSLDMTIEELTKAPAFAYDGKTKTLVNNQ